MRLYLIRHLPVPAGKGVCYGRLDLAAEGASAAHIAYLRAQIPPGTPVFSSPAQRCLALANQLYPGPHIDPRLQELDFGSWEGCAWSNIGADALDAWIAAGYDGAAHGGESLSALQHRVWQWADVQQQTAATAAVTHAGVIRALWSRFQPISDCLNLAVPHGEVIVLDW